MNILILDGQNNVIAKVANSGNPERDVKDYGGTSWQLYQESASERINRKQRIIIRAINREAYNRLQAVDPILTEEFVSEQLWLKSQGYPQPTTPGLDLQAAQAIVQHAKAEIIAIKAADEAALDAYDPATGWP